MKLFQPILAGLLTLVSLSLFEVPSNDVPVERIAKASNFQSPHLISITSDPIPPIEAEPAIEPVVEPTPPQSPFILPAAPAYCDPHDPNSECRLLEAAKQAVQNARVAVQAVQSQQLARDYIYGSSFAGGSNGSYSQSYSQPSYGSSGSGTYGAVYQSTESYSCTGGPVARFGARVGSRARNVIAAARPRSIFARLRARR